LLLTALNKAAINEYRLKVAELRRERLIQLAVEFEAQELRIEAQKSQLSGASQAVQSDLMGGAAKKKNKKNDKEALAKKLQ